MVTGLTQFVILFLGIKASYSNEWIQKDNTNPVVVQGTTSNIQKVAQRNRVNTNREHNTVNIINNYSQV